VELRAVEQHGSGVGLHHARNQVEQRGLAGTVRADQPDHAPGVQAEIDVARDNDAVKTLAQVLDLEDGGHDASLDRCGARQMSRAGTSPCGRKNMKTSTRPVNSSPWMGPSTLGGSCRKLIACGSASSSSAPITGPQVVRMPPT